LRNEGQHTFHITRSLYVPCISGIQMSAQNHSTLASLKPRRAAVNPLMFSSMHLRRCESEGNHELQNVLAIRHSSSAGCNQTRAAGCRRSAGPHTGAIHVSHLHDMRGEGSSMQAYLFKFSMQLCSHMTVPQISGTKSYPEILQSTLVTK
jgi:hypothetical protein